VRDLKNKVDIVLNGREGDSGGVAEGNGLVETGVIAGNAKNCLKAPKGCLLLLTVSVSLEQKIQAFRIEMEHIRNIKTAFWNGL